MENKWFIIAIVVLSLITVGLGGFIVYDKVFVVKKEEAEKTIIGEKEIDLNVFYKIGETLDTLDKAFNDSTSAYFGYPYLKAEVKVDKFDKGAALFVAMYKDLIKTNTPQVLKGQRVKNNYEKLFGKNLTYTPTNVSSGEKYNVMYVKDGDYYAYTILENKLLNQPEYRCINISTKLYDDEIIVKRKIFYVEYALNPEGTERIKAAVYKDSSKKKLITTIDLKTGYLNDDEIIAKYSSSVNTYTYSFKEKQADKHIISSIKKEY